MSEFERDSFWSELFGPASRHVLQPGAQRAFPETLTLISRLRYALLFFLRGLLRCSTRICQKGILIVKNICDRS
jgi:hypothetical protein